MKTKNGKQPETNSLVDRLVVSIRDSILAGNYKPGAHVGIKKIADAHGTSMIPVREALARMLASRLVRVEANRGYFVADRPTSEKFQQFVQFREVFEVSAVSLGFEAVTDADVTTLHRLNEEMRVIARSGKSDVMVEWGRLNGAFHQVLVGFARNSFISDQYENLSFDHMHFQLARAYNIKYPSLNLLVEQHDEMIQALEARDKTLLITRLSEHINNLNLSA